MQRRHRAQRNRADDLSRVQSDTTQLNTTSSCVALYTALESLGVLPERDESQLTGHVIGHVFVG